MRRKNRINPGTSSDRVTGFEDWLPTLLELINVKSHQPIGIDGISFAPTLRGEKQKPRPFLYRESPGYGGQQCVRIGDWKAVRQNLNPEPGASDLQPGAIELYNLRDDPGETSNVAGRHPDIVGKFGKVMKEQHTKSTLFPMRALDDESK